MAVTEFIMRLYRKTPYKVCYRDHRDRIGRIYLPLSFIDQMGIGEEMLVQLALTKEEFAPGGYAVFCVRDKETPKKVRFIEKINEKGELGAIYVTKALVEYLEVKDEIAVRIASATPVSKEGAIIVQS